MKTILVTGGAGYIGSHTVVELQQAGYRPIVVDNLVNASVKSLERVAQITGQTVPFYELDLLDSQSLEKVFEKETIDACIHFAGLKSVNESVEKPVEYYKNNVCGTLSLLEVMQKYDVKNIVFSSSATVYGDPKEIPITESCQRGEVTNPYGETKVMIEKILKDLYTSNNSWNITMLRYFNPIGAHKSGLIGENPYGIPNNLMPYITQVASGKLEELKVCGDDYDTPDGTGVRDYIHVADLAMGHVDALKTMDNKHSLEIYNLGTGRGYSVLELIRTFEQVNGLKIPFVITERRAGDIAECYADSTKAQRELGWKVRYGIREMCEDAWRWQKMNPQGYEA